MEKSLWNIKLVDEFKKPYFLELKNFIKKEFEKNKTIYPPIKDIYRALHLVDYNRVKVVIIGQDPYHGKGQANGLAFAVNSNITAPPSLKNIFKEIFNEYGEYPKNYNLEGWAKQGVLLLNTVLTVVEKSPASHKNIGWEVFTDAIIKNLNERENPIVFILWGAFAQSKKLLITNLTHRILASPHPSPFSAHSGFFGCNHFKLCNQILEDNKAVPINWLDS